MEEKRRYKRWQIEKAAQCRFEESALDCFLKDISFKGAGIPLKAVPEDLSKTCDLRIAIADDAEPLNVDCDIVWQRKTDKNTELGLYFRRIKDRDKERIFRYVFERYPEQLTKDWWSGDGEQRYRYHYNDGEIEELAERVKAAAAKTKMLFAFFNNHWQAYAPRNANDLKKALKLPYEQLPLNLEFAPDKGDTKKGEN